MKLAITTESEFIVQTFDEEKAKDNKNFARIFKDSLIPKTKAAEDFFEENYSFKLMPGIKNHKQIKGVLAAIKGISYRIYQDNPFKIYKEYPLEGYCIPCIVTKDRKVYPLLRAAKYDEKWIFVKKDDYLESKNIPKDKLAEVISPILNKDWPLLLKI